MRTKPLALIALAVVVVLAGCTGAPTDTASTNPDNSTALQTDVASAMESVETYHLSTNTSITQAANGQQRTQQVVATGAFDRTAEAFQINQTASTSGITQQISTYFRNGTVYEYSPSYASQYGAEWVTLEPNASFFAQQDTLTRQRTFLENATITTNGTETINGTETQVLEADVDETATTSAIAARLGTTGQDVTYNVTSVSQRLWVDTETNRPLRTTFSMNATVTQQGETSDLSMSADMRFTYDGTVSITLPAGAESAVSLG